MKNQFPPMAFIIGAQKAGTTTLAHLLSQHSQISLANPKEPQFFSYNWDRGFGWYRACFSAAPGQILLDASTSYTMSSVPDGPDRPADDTIAKRISSSRPDAKLIYVLRDPVERTYSAYCHNLRSGDEKRELRAAIEANPGFTDPSCYKSQTMAFLKHFDRSALMFVDFRSLVADPTAVAKLCLEFLGVDEALEEIDFERARNSSFVYSPVGTIIRGIFGGEKGMKKIAGVARSILPESVQAVAKRVVTEDAPELCDDDRAWLQDNHQTFNTGLEQLAGFNWHPGDKE